MLSYALCLELVKNRSSKPEAAQKEEAGKKLTGQPVWGGEGGWHEMQAPGREPLPLQGTPPTTIVLTDDGCLSCPLPVDF